MLGRRLSEETKRKISLANLSIPVSKEVEIIDLYKELTADEISSKLNISRSIIYSCLKRNGIKKRPVGHKKGKPTWNKGIRLSGEQKSKLNMGGLEIGRGLFKGQSGIYSQETLEKMSKAHKGKVGKNSANWKGGISFEPYGKEFNNKLKSRIRVRDSNQCQVCFIYEDNKTHHVHHVDYCKKNNDPSNLITLCVTCHGKTNGNRESWMRYFQALLQEALI